MSQPQPLNQSPCQPWRKGCFPPSSFFGPGHILLTYTRDTPMKPASPQLFFFFFFSFKINKRCHSSAHSTVAIRAVCLKEILASQTNPCASVSPNTFLSSFSNSSAWILNLISLLFNFQLVHFTLGTQQFSPALNNHLLPAYFDSLHQNATATTILFVRLTDGLLVHKS